MAQREVCGGCRSTDIRPVLNLGASPLADDFPIEPNTEQKFYPLGLLRCFHCTLIQLSEVVPDEELWGGDYGFYTGSSWVAVEQQAEYARALLKRYPTHSRRLTVEIACNDGTMLQHFNDAGCLSVGIDPAAGPVDKAREKGLKVYHEPFGQASAKLIRTGFGQAGLIVANNVVAHVSDLDDFLGGVDTLLHPTGVAVFEFQYAADLVTGNQIDHVYHEHRFFFSLHSFTQALSRHGLYPEVVEQTTPQGGSLRVHVRKDHTRTDHSIHDVLHDEHWLRDEHCLAGMQGRADRIRSRILAILVDARDEGLRVAGYGASAKSTTLLNFCDIDTELVQYFVDATPMKWGRYTPGTSIPIINPSADSRAPDIYLLTIWNYAAQVMKRESAFQGKWLVPIPVPVLM